jgi:hypothetical protein
MKFCLTEIRHVTLEVDIVATHVLTELFRKDYVANLVKSRVKKRARLY